jgi:NADPH:quinone reductase-like Zn-dependent oxidoreductase
MKAITMSKYGGPDVMSLEAMPKPKPGPDDILIQVHAAGLNPVDWKIRKGDLKAVLSFDMPMIMGNELSGVVEAVGTKVSAFKPGDEVYTRVDNEHASAFAEFSVVDHSLVALKPKNISFDEAAGIPLAGLTAWQSLFDRMQLKSGQKILVHAGAGGVGTLAIQFAKHAGAFVATTASTCNHDMLKELGVDLCIDYNEQDFIEVVKDYDAVLDCMGGKVLERSIGCVKPGGWVVNLAGLPDPITAKEMGIPTVFRFFLSLMTRKVVNAAKRAGVNYRFLALEPRGDQLKEIAQLIEAGAVKPVVDSVHSFDRYADAFTHLEDGHAHGKIILSFNK